MVKMMVDVIQMYVNSMNALVSCRTVEFDESRLVCLYSEEFALRLVSMEAVFMRQMCFVEFFSAMTGSLTFHCKSLVHGISGSSSVVTG